VLEGVKTGFAGATWDASRCPLRVKVGPGV